jgi:hypothetical protein
MSSVRFALVEKRTHKGLKMISYQFSKALRNNKRIRNRPEREVWHFENPDYSPLCFVPDPSKRHWDNGIGPNPRGLLTTDNVEYVTCKRCMAILKKREIIKK